MPNPEPAPVPVFIDFEGIDGSGKTTLSSRLADLLKAQGVPVHHARDGGIFRSEISKEIRTLTRDPRFLRMSHITEFLLYVARDTQMIDEFIRPKLRPGNVVFSDRYLYSAITHSHHARGLSRAEVDAVLNMASRGLWPDLVVYCDVDPLTSRIRKKIQKIRDQRMGDFGRKGLMGIGFREEMRKGFLQLAEEDPQRWLVIDNVRSTIDESVERIYERVRTLLEARGYTLDLKKRTPGVETAKAERPASTFASGVAKVLAVSDPEERKSALYSHFFAELERIEPSNPAYAALFLSSLDTPEANRLRERIMDREPAMVAHGLQGLSSPESISLRRRLMARAPTYVARSLSGLAESPEVTSLRMDLLESEPAQVALSIRGRDTDLAWQLRERIVKKGKREVLISLRGIDSERAWALREKRGAQEQHYRALLESLGGLDTDRAWEWRDRLGSEYLPWVLISLRGLRSDRSWALREEHIQRAPKIIIKTIGTSDDPRAWQLRRTATWFAKEVLDSLSGMDSGPAWALRLELRGKWPNTVVSSLGAGAQYERAWNFRWEMLRDFPDNILLAKHVVKANFRALDVDDCILDEDDDGGNFT
jgi:dTMP kinase